MPVPDSDVKVGRIYLYRRFTVRVLQWDGTYVIVGGPKSYSPHYRIEPCYLRQADLAQVQFFIAHLPL